MGDSSSYKLCASKVTLRFTGLPWTCLEMVVAVEKAPNIAREAMLSEGGMKDFFW